MLIVKDMAGLAKLRSERPSTAAIGNWGLLQAMERLNSDLNLSVGHSTSIRLFMGKKKTPRTKIDVSLSKKDTEETIRSQWDALRSAVCHPRQVLLFHLKNHYALIFAVREWAEEGPQGTILIRQVLTARKGQRPTAWLSFDEVRDVMLNWEGYKILAIEHHHHAPSGAASIYASSV